jgi:hypothetical protein
VLFKRDQLQKAMSSIQHDLERLIVAGDWCLYLELLRYGKIAYSAQSLNSHRRHSHSVTTTSNRERHFEEVKEMQKRALDIIRQTQPSPCDLDHLQRRADQYLAVLATQFAAAS